MERKVVMLQVSAIVQVTDADGNVVDIQRPPPALLYHPMIEGVESYIKACEKEEIKQDGG